MAYYYPPTADGTRPGRFFFNRGRPDGRGPRSRFPPWPTTKAYPATTLQIALAIENTGIHDIHRHSYLPAFGEGWGLYSERLADEMGLYTDDWERVGMLTADSLRAGRLVVDTGIHALGWSRRKAIEFLADHSPMSIHEITEEVDRYIACPGQACPTCSVDSRSNPSAPRPRPGWAPGSISGASTEPFSATAPSR